MTASWPEWHRQHFDGLLNYILPDEAGRLGAFPAKSDREPLLRLREIYEALADRGIRYEYEPTGAAEGYQRVRPPHEVLVDRGLAGTCLDLNLVAAGLCLRAGLHPLLIEVPGHVVLGVWVGDGLPAASVNWDGAPNPAYPEDRALDAPGLERLGLRRAVGDDGGVVAVDVAAVADGYRSPSLGFDEAVAEAGRLVAGGGSLRVCDVGWSWRDENQLNPGVGWEVTGRLFPKSIFDDADLTMVSPARLTRAQYRVVPFRPSDTYRVVVDRAMTATADRGPVVLLAHGGGGVGKSRLGAEVAAHLASLGWTAGILRRGDLPGINLVRLGAVRGPLFVAVDYAETASISDLRDLVRAVQGHDRHPAVVLLLARTAGHWWKHFTDACYDDQLEHNDHVLDQLPAMAITERVLWERSFRALAAVHARRQDPSIGTARAEADAREIEVPSLPPRPRRQRWSSLDLVLLAGLQIRNPESVPDDRAELYDEVLRHEYEYWLQKRDGGKDEKDEKDESQFRQWAAHLTMASPATVQEAAGVAPKIDRPSMDAFATIWAGGWDGWGRCEPLQLEPDSVGDYLARKYFGDHVAEFATLAQVVADGDDPAGASEGGEPGPFDRLAANLLRSETDVIDDPDDVTALWYAALAARPSLWPRLLRTADHGSAACAAALERLLDQVDTSNPAQVDLVMGLSLAVPLAHATLRRVGELAGEQAGQLTRSGSDAERAQALNNLGIRLSEAGRREDALGPTEEAVAIRRRLADGNPGAFLPNLAASLNNLGAMLSEAGRGAEVEGRWLDSVQGLRSTAAQAWLQALIPSAYGESHLAKAMRAIDGLVDDELLGPARRAVRQVALDRQHGDGPQWAVAPLDEAAVGWINEWLSASSWPQNAAWLTAHAVPDRIGAVRPAVGVAADLFPEQPAVAQLADLLAKIDGGEIDLADYCRQGDSTWSTHQVVVEWLATRSWTDSRALLSERGGQLRTGAARAAVEELAGRRDTAAVANQHLAILHLLDEGHDEHEVFEWASNGPALQLRILDALEEGQLNILGALLAINPGAVMQPPHPWLLPWLHLVLNPDHRSQALPEGTTPVEAIEPMMAGLGRDARHAVRLRLNGFARHLEPIDGADQLRHDVDQLRQALR